MNGRLHLQTGRLRVWHRRVLGVFCAALCWLAAGSLQAKLTRLDVFLGYDTIVPEGNWFPVAIEVQNNGPAFEAVFEVMPSQFARGQIRRMVVELPTGTTKRFVIPVFNASRGNATWDVIVRDTRGNKRDEVRDIRPRRTMPLQAPLVGALVRTVGGMPEFPAVDKTYSYMQPHVARLQPALFADNPVALGGLAGLYLNAEKAQELKENQVKALLAWMSEGGHLVVALHQPSDLQASPWLRDLLPVEISGQQNLPVAGTLQQYIGESTPRLWTLTASQDSSLAGYRNLKPDEAFQGAPLPVVTGRARGGRTVLAAGGVPLVISAPQGRGTVTVLTFSPETEPFRSWQHRKQFWAKIFEIPTEWITQSRKTGYSDYSGWSMDSIFGAVTDSRQVRKLPVGWLLLLLLTYLAVIGPLDQFVLKKLNRQMLTWLTFPAYVLMFSVLIYFIGYKLRAGDVEWNEFHLVDSIQRGDGGAAMRGHAFASIYSPANARYQLESTALYASLRDEYAGSYGGSGLDANRSYIEQRGNSFAAEISVPVWTSQLYVGDWWQAAKEAPLAADITRAAGEWQVKVRNRLPHKVARIAIIANGRVHEFAGLAARQDNTFRVNPNGGQAVSASVANYADRFWTAASSRRSALGGNDSVRPEGDEILRWAVAGSFLNSQVVDQQHNYRRFQAPLQFDLSASASRGDVIIFAWIENQLLVKPMNQDKFSTRRSRFDTVIRLVVPEVKSS